MINSANAEAIYSEAQTRLEELRKLEAQLLSRLQKYPRGKIHIVQRGRQVMYYLRKKPSERTGTYISVHDEKKLKTYLQKFYDEKLLKLVEKEIPGIESFLMEFRNKPEEIRNLYLKFPEKSRKYLKAADLPDDEYARLWLAIPFETKGLSGNLPDYTTQKGEHVRSKSELNIANTLYRLNVPYKYECPLTFPDGIVIYPDFTVLNVKKRKVLYWEHRGMMDDREYAKYAVDRVKEYQNNQIFLGDGLIITEETLKQPLGTEEINRVIQKYLLWFEPQRKAMGCISCGFFDESVDPACFRHARE